MKNQLIKYLLKEVENESCDDLFLSFSDENLYSPIKEPKFKFQLIIKINLRFLICFYN